VHKVAFFTEAGSKKGYGHLVRSYTIFEKFQSLDAQFFIDSDINFDDKFENLHYFSWDTLSIKQKYDVILIDSYEADLKIYNMLQQHTKLLICIDDFNRLDYPSGMIINFAPNAENLHYSTKKKNYTYLLGLEYMPIRKDFLKQQVKKQEQIFIMLGGADITNLTLKLVQNLQNVNMKKVVVHNNPKIAQELTTIANVTVLFQPDDISLIKSMKESSIAITTASMSAYEFAFLKIPTIIIAIAENQKNGVTQFLNHNIAAYSLEDVREIIFLIQNIQNNEYSLSNTIDGLGTQRIYNKVMELL